MAQPVELTPGQIRRIADRYTGIGCDQLLLILRSNNPAVDVMYRVFNSDGSEAQQSGNGARCVGRYLHVKGIIKKSEIIAETVNATIRIIIEGGNAIRVNMGVPRFDPADIPLSTERRRATYKLDLQDVDKNIFALSMGNPHAVLMVDDVDKAEVEKLGPQIQQHPLFPEGVNVGFLQIIDRNHVRLRVYERGAGETQACGSGSCAAVVAGIMNKQLDNEVVVGLKRGNLIIKWDGEGSEVWMTGPAVIVFEGQIDI
jgi:diaminopimelate epimerase